MWATRRLRDYIVDGFFLGDDQLKRRGGNHLDEVLARRAPPWLLRTLCRRRHPAVLCEIEDTSDGPEVPSREGLRQSAP